MAATISAALNASPTSTGAVLTMGGLGPYSGSKMTVIRTDQLGNLAPVKVRGADNISIIGATMVVTDYEIPINIACRYEIQIFTSGVLVVSAIYSGYVTVDTSNPMYPYPYNNFWINNISNPTQSIPVLVEDFNDLTFQATILGEYKILGRKNPVLFSDVWGARSGSFTVDSLNINGLQYSMAAHETLLTSGDTLMFQSGVNPYILTDMYFVIKGLDREIVGGVRSGSTPSVRYNISFQEVDMPPTSGQIFGLGTWGELRDDPGASAATWTSVQAGFATWNALLNNYSG